MYRNRREDTGTNVCELTPDGLTFSVPVTLDIALPPAAGVTDMYHIFWWNEAEEIWEDLGGTTSPGHVSVSIEHFSKYRLDQVE